MMFRNAQIYRLPAPWSLTAEQLAEQLARKPLHACGSQDMETRGWLPPRDDAMVHAVGGQWLIRFGLEHRLLPASVVQAEANTRADDIATRQGFKPGRKQMKELREQVAQELMPRAFTKRSHVDAWIDPLAGWMVIDAASPARAETVLEHLRHTLDSFPLTLLRTERSPVSGMADWLAGEAPAGFTIDQDCELRSITEDHAAVRYLRHTLEGADVKSHLEGGKLPIRLALTYNDRVSFVLGQTLALSRIDFLDVTLEKLDNPEDAAAQADAEFALMTGQLGQLLPALVDALGGELKVA